MKEKIQHDHSSGRAGGIRLTQGQLHIVGCLVKNCDHKQVQTLGGFAGTGKTTILTTLNQRLPEFAPCAFTGKAVNVMRQKGMDARTIHSLLYNAVRKPDGQLAFVLKTQEEISCSGFLVDEGSMIGQQLHDDLLSFGLPVIFVGDHGQLPPVGDAMISLMANPDFRLEEIHRNAGPIANFAQHLRLGKKPRKFDGGDGVRVLEKAEVSEGILRKTARVGQMICGFNTTRVKLNRKGRLLLRRQSLLEVGDRVICLRNNHAAGLFNGQMGVVGSVDLSQHTLDFETDTTVYDGLKFARNVFGEEKPNLKYDGGSTHPFDYGYALTCHKAQGDEWGRVLVFEELHPDWDRNRWSYTAASRAKVRLLWVVA